ncbi:MULTISPECIES: hypothetical protein [unclassified Pseudonocardia]|jgi:hypothetical protein|uniref:hypothetical protein n=1 Tax=unclassified Pseudonocardia TaxID=2619320 RepID=UPI00096894E1|nr:MULTISPECIES: hypothetical protein [unclassified Pseudonocardia]MBN9102217.1 hypothetical protein [Pseudonocardia sp.]OJY51515.1 MAG: hypothetical protein BGP03_16525 [Pseudonocardia sp. 73-21]
MNNAKRYTLAALATAAIAVSVVGTGIAQASEDNGAAPDGPATQSPTQGLSAILGTADNGNFQLMDALNGDNRPDGANGVESEFPPADPRYVEGPVGGLVKNGPQG